jgi:hypothetical protein
MKEIIRKNAELIRNDTSILYPAYMKYEIESEGGTFIFFNRAQLMGKDVSRKRYGSPNHGEYFWEYTGKSPLFEYKIEGDVASLQQQKNKVNLEGVVRRLQTDMIALFNWRDVEIANQLGLFPDALTKNLTEIKPWIAKEERNGIMLVPIPKE